jgi:hypothetical protein
LPLIVVIFSVFFFCPHFIAAPFWIQHVSLSGNEKTPHRSEKNSPQKKNEHKHTHTHKEMKLFVWSRTKRGFVRVCGCETSEWQESFSLIPVNNLSKTFLGLSWAWALSVSLLPVLKGQRRRKLPILGEFWRESSLRGISFPVFVHLFLPMVQSSVDIERNKNTFLQNTVLLVVGREYWEFQIPIQEFMETIFD